MSVFGFADSVIAPLVCFFRYFSFFRRVCVWLQLKQISVISNQHCSKPRSGVFFLSTSSVTHLQTMFLITTKRQRVFRYCQNEGNFFFNKNSVSNKTIEHTTHTPYTQQKQRNAKLYSHNIFFIEILLCRLPL